jgi:putative ABC transport system permease protein
VDRRDAPEVIVISETMARRYWPNESPIGKRIGSGRPDEWREIVGVVSDVKQFGLSQDARPTMYLPLRQQPARRMVLVVRSREDAPSLAPLLRRAVASLDPNLAVSNLKTMERITAESIGTERFTLLLLGTFAGIALMLAGVGIYGVMAYSVTQRTQEIGIRMALGARVGDIFRLVIGRGVKLVLIGVATGLAASFALTRLMASLLYGVSATDPAVFAGIALLLVGVALLACYLPARRATKVDPLIALRYE